MSSFRSIEESQTLWINQRTKDLMASGKEIHKFGFGQSPFMPPKHVMDALSANVHRKDYGHVQGEQALRENVSIFHQELNGIEADPENIFVAPGSKILIYSILLAFEEADVLIAAPSWVSYAPQAKLARHNCIKIKTTFEEKWRVTPINLQAALNQKKTKHSIMILNFPGNPDGLSYTQGELEELATIFRKYNVLVISDEIYGLLDFENTHISLSTIYPERTITTTGLSKWCGAGGWRMGIALMYDNLETEFKKALIGIASESYSCAALPVQKAAEIAYSNVAIIKEYLSKQIEILVEVSSYIHSELSTSGIKVYRPKGGFYMFLDFSEFKVHFKSLGINSSKSLCETLLNEKGVAILPGSAFAMESSELVARLAFVDFLEPEENEEFDIEKHGQSIISGTQKLCSWLPNY